MIVERSMHASWLSNAFLLADEPGGTAVFVDSGAPLEPLLAAVEREGVTPTHLMITHGHADHVAGNDELVERFSLEVTSGPVETGGLRIESLATPGHSDDGVSFVVGDLCFSGDTLFRDAVGGGPADEMRRSVMDVLMTLPHDTRVLPGHTDETTIGREWEENPFVRFWRGLDGEDGRACTVQGDDCDPRRLVARLRRQGQGARSSRRRLRGDRRRFEDRRALTADPAPPLPVPRLQGQPSVLGRAVGARRAVDRVRDRQGAHVPARAAQGGHRAHGPAPPPGDRARGRLLVSRRLEDDG